MPYDPSRLRHNFGGFHWCDRETNLSPFDNPEVHLSSATPQSTTVIAIRRVYKFQPTIITEAVLLSTSSANKWCVVVAVSLCDFNLVVIHLEN